MTDIAQIENEIIITLLAKAKAKHSDIYPCGKCKTVESGVTTHGNKTVLWYNDKNGSSHVVTYVAPGPNNRELS